MGSLGLCYHYFSTSCLLGLLLDGEHSGVAGERTPGWGTHSQAAAAHLFRQPTRVLWFGTGRKGQCPCSAGDGAPTVSSPQAAFNMFATWLPAAAAQTQWGSQVSRWFGTGAMKGHCLRHAGAAAAAAAPTIRCPQALADVLQ